MDDSDENLPNIERAHLVFSHVCNMQCGFCYVDFSGEKVDQAETMRVIDRISELGVDVLTISGGDPFNYKWFPELVIYAAKGGMQLHVDTNSLKLREEHYSMLEEHVSWLGLPLDGPNAEISDTVRDYPGHFASVTKHLDALRSRDIQIKVNTVVTEQNWSSIGALAQLLEEYRINRWSLYEFFPLEAGLKNRERFELGDGHWELAVAAAQLSERPFTVEPGSRDDRRPTYFLVDHQGRLIIKQTNESHLVLGSIFEDTTVKLWEQHGQRSIRSSARTRYNLPMLTTLSSGNAERATEITAQP